MTPPSNAAAAVWLAGEHGMLGSVLKQKIVAAGARCVGSDRELDIADEGAVFEFVRRARPALVINAAAYTRVDDAETNQADAFRVNADGAEIVARAALEIGAPVVHYSTDYVFAGDARLPYAEDAATAPRGVYAKSKHEGEQRVLATASRGGRPYVIRTSWLFGENGPNFVRTMVGLMQQKQELRVVADQHGRPTYTRDLADATLALLAVGGGAAAAPGVYHFANSGATTWHAFTLGIRDALIRRRVPVSVERILAVSTAEFPRPAPRPAYSVLGTARIEAALGRAPRPWAEALDDYLATEF